MERKIGAFDARRQFGRVLNEVATKGDAYVVERHGEAIAAVVPIALYEQWKRTREAFFDRLEQTARRANMSEAEGMALAREAVQAVRTQRRARQAQPTT
jgi:prevent-host-death family protein